jgi:hypothetical protein
MPVQEALLVLYACRDNLVPLLHSDSARPRVRCAILQMLTVMCTAASSRHLHDNARVSGEVLYTVHGDSIMRPKPLTVSTATAPHDDLVAVANEAMGVVLEAGVLSACCRILSTVPTDLYLQTQVRGVSDIDDVRMQSLALLAAVVCHDGVELMPGQRRDLEAAAEAIIRCLVAVAAHFRSPDAQARARSLHLSLKVWNENLLAVCSMTRLSLAVDLSRLRCVCSLAVVLLHSRIQHFTLTPTDPSPGVGGVITFLRGLRGAVVARRPVPYLVDPPGGSRGCACPHSRAVHRGWAGSTLLGPHSAVL